MRFAKYTQTKLVLVVKRTFLFVSVANKNVRFCGEQECSFLWRTRMFALQNHI